MNCNCSYLYLKAIRIRVAVTGHCLHLKLYLDNLYEKKVALR